MKYGKIEYGVNGAYYKEDEDKIIQEAADRLDDNLRDKFDAYEQGYGTYYKDFEQWFDRYAPKVLSEVLDEVEDERLDAEDIIERQEQDKYDDYDEQVRREYYRDRI